MEELWEQHKAWIIVGAVVLVKLATMAIAWYMSNVVTTLIDQTMNGFVNPPSTPSYVTPSSPTASSGPEQTVVVTPEQWVSDFSVNDVRAKDFYAGKRVKMTGKVMDIVDQSNGRASVAFSMQSENSFLPKVFMFTYTKEFRSKIANLNDGMTVTCEGRWVESLLYSVDYNFEGLVLYKGCETIACARVAFPLAPHLLLGVDF